MNDGKPFEAVTETVFRTLSRNDKYSSVDRDTRLEDVRGQKRQVDVLVEAKVLGFETKTLIECKDYKRRVGVGHVDALDSKRRDLPVDFAVLVSRNGFTQGAIIKAKSVGIRLCTLEENVDVSVLGLDLHLCVLEVFPKHSRFSFSNDAGKNLTFTPSMARINGLTPIEFLRKGLENGYLAIRNFTDPIEYSSKSGEFNVSMTDGTTLPVSYLTIECEYRYYLGKLSDLEGTILFDNLIEEKKNAFFNQEQLREYKSRFKEAKPSDPFSLAEGECLHVYKLVPDIEFSNAHGAIFGKDGSLIEEYGTHCGPECKAALSKIAGKHQN